MRIDPKGTIRGYPTLLVRQTLRCLRGDFVWGETALEKAAKLTPGTGCALAKALEAEGLIKASPPDGWIVTQAGDTLSVATAANPVSRQTAERALAQFLERVARVNEDPYFLARVTRVALYGSMLRPEVKRLSDVDLAVQLVAKETNSDRLAQEILAWRAQDGFSDTLPPYLGGTQPGQWRPTPPAMAPGLAPQLANTTPWVIRSPSQFRTAGPPAMTSDQYLADYNETKSMGSATNSGRTNNQTLFANFWQAGNPPDYFNPVVLSLAAQHHYSMVQTARLLALVNLGMADAIIGCWDAKYTYSFWRPITAIQLGDTDGNDNTIADPAWTPLITTPPFPEYPSAHSCVSGAATQILSATFGEETYFNVQSNAMLGVTRTFTNFSAALEEIKNARVFGGIHFRTACVDGTALGISVGDYVMAHALLPDGGGGR